LASSEFEFLALRALFAKLQLCECVLLFFHFPVENVNDFPSLSSTAALTQVQVVLFSLAIAFCYYFRYTYELAFVLYLYRLAVFCSGVFCVLNADQFVFINIFCLFIDFLVLCSSPACYFANAAEIAINCSFISPAHTDTHAHSLTHTRDGDCDADCAAHVECPLIKSAIFFLFVFVFYLFSSHSFISCFFRFVIVINFCYQPSALPTSTALPFGAVFFVFLFPVCGVIFCDFAIFLLPRCVVFPVISTC